MKEIKLRVWDNEMENMIYPHEAFDRGHHTFSCYGTSIEYFNLQNGFRTKNIMLYSGLKDKAGKEVYHLDKMRSDKGVVFTIHWSDKKARFYGKAKNVWNKVSDSYIRKTIEWCVNNYEVIGNQYKNPELS